MKCPTCNQLHMNPKFCCQSCAASYNNRAKPKRQPEGNCRRCNKVISTARTYCSDCWSGMLKSTRDRSLAEIEYKTGHKSAAFSAVREHARRKSRFARVHQCERCGYSKHVECCHIRAISEFPADATVAEVNADENILVLCPNCHWEFDRGMLDISEISLIPDPQSLLF